MNYLNVVKQMIDDGASLDAVKRVVEAIEGLGVAPAPAQVEAPAPAQAEAPTPAPVETQNQQMMDINATLRELITTLQAQNIANNYIDADTANPFAASLKGVTK